MTQFDGSTAGTIGDNSSEFTPHTFPNSGGRIEPEPPVRLSALDMLAEEVADRDSEEEELYPVEIPGLRVRLMCRLDFSATQWQNWQRAAIPRAKRKRPSAIDMQTDVLAMQVLTNTCEHLEFQPDGSKRWEVLTGANGEPLNLESDELLARFKQMDSQSLLRKLFRRDASLLAAGTDVINASGFGEPDEARGAASDPTD